MTSQHNTGKKKKKIVHHLHMVCTQQSVLSNLSVGYKGGGGGPHQSHVQPCMKVNPLLVCALFIH